MATQQSVVTPERLAQGVDYKTWMDKIDRNQEKFVENYEGTTPNPDDVKAFKSTIAKKGGTTSWPSASPGAPTWCAACPSSPSWLRPPAWA